jgi:hypothetical protein
MDVKFELKGVKEAMSLFDPNKVRLAANQALNRSATSGVGTAGKLIRGKYNIAQARLAQYLKLTTKASGYTMVAEISGRARGLALAYFDAKQAGKFIAGVGRGKRRKRYLGSKYGRGHAGDVTVSVKRAGGRKVVSPKYSNKPFLAQMKSGHIGVWVRTGKKRKPIEQLFGPGVAQVFGTRDVMDGTTKAVNDRFAVEFPRQLDYYLGRS